jgi:SAM-dependent methyltransferase
MSLNELQQQATNCLRENQYSEAIAIYEQCIQLHPGELFNYWYLGLALLLQGNEEEAQLTWLSVMLEPDSPEVNQKLGELINILETEAFYYDDSENLTAAERIYWQILQQQPEHFYAYCNLGNIRTRQGDFAEAIAFYQQAIEINSHSAETFYKIANCYENKGDFFSALNYYYASLIREPENLTYRQGFIECFKYIPFDAISPELLQEIEKSFTIPGIDYQSILPVTINALQLDAEFQQVLNWAVNHQIDTLTLAYQQLRLQQIFHNSLFQAILQHTVIVGSEWEIFLTLIRRNILLDWQSEIPAKAVEIPFLLALASQCFNNEYIYAVSTAESQELINLKSDLDTWLKNNQITLSDEFIAKLATFSMYQPLHTLDGVWELLKIPENNWLFPIKTLIKSQLKDYQEEQEIKTTIKCITNQFDGVSLAVKTQYEENPYPRWLSVNLNFPQNLSSYLGYLLPQVKLPDFTEKPIKILEAGCGTGRQAIGWASLLNDTEILAIDLSACSIAYAIRKARELGIFNISFQQGDILGLSNLDRRFPIIISTGVLHHLENPVSGWKILVDLLQPLGLMKIGLYSQKARIAVNAAREFIQSQGLQNTAADMRKGRQELLQLPPDHPAKEVTEYRDFYNLSDCRDLLFHVQEHQFTLPRVADILADLGLKFVGFEFRNPQIKNNYQEMFPEDSAMTNLLFWDKFEETYPSTFGGMYNFWCQKI